VRALVLRLQIVIALLVAMLAAGRGLPGLVQAARGAETHVCTCAAGGDHASCPVCNHALLEQRRSTAPAAQGVPCGPRGVMADAEGDIGTLPPVVASLAPPFARLAAPLAILPAEREVPLEPATPPPRRAAT
jgi:hypothetical protein